MAIRLSARACVSTVTKPHGGFDSLEGEQDYCALCVTVKLETGEEQAWEMRGGMNAMHVWEVVLARFEFNDLNMCYTWESSERKVQTKALAIRPCRGHRWRNHKDCETEAVEKTLVEKKGENMFFKHKMSNLVH